MRLLYSHQVVFKKSISKIVRDLSIMAAGGVKFGDIISKLDEIAPTHLAESWDNVGLLVEPSTSKDFMVNKIMVTNDLTEKVLDEAIEKNANFIISYHPPIFVPLKRLCNNSWKQRIITRCIENKIGLYSPHTALDAVNYGVNHWLINSLDVSNSRPIHQSNSKGSWSQKVSIEMPLSSCKEESINNFIHNVKKCCFVSDLVTESKQSANGEYKLVNCLCNENDLTEIMSFLNDQQLNTTAKIEVMKLSELPLSGYGMGRIGKLNESLTLEKAVENIKSYLGLEHVRLATAKNANINSKIKIFAVCAGSGASVLRGVKADLILSGEMSHHEVLEFVHKGTSVILCDHSNSERGYLKHYAEQLRKELVHSDLQIFTSVADADPLVIV